MDPRRVRLSLDALESRETPASLAAMYAAAAQTQANAGLVRTLSSDFGWMANPAFRPVVVQFAQNLFQQSTNAMSVMTGPGWAGPGALAAANAAVAQNLANWLGFFVVPPPPPLTVTINQAPTQADPTSTAKAVFNVRFSTPVTGFTTSDISFTGSTAGGTLAAAVTGSGAAYTVEVTGMTSSGKVIVGIPAGAAVNSRGQRNRASTSNDKQVTFDVTPPTVTINQGNGQFDPANSSPVTFNVVFNESVTGFTSSDVSFAGSTVGGTLAANVTGTGAVYTVSVTGMTGEGTVVATIGAGAATDLAVTQAPPPPPPTTPLPSLR